MKYILLFLLLFQLNCSFAQVSNSCRDTLRIQSNSPCGSYGYNPVCGCNNKTYRNECYAYSDGLIIYQQGICEPFALDFFPNAINDVNSESFFPTIVSKLGTPCSLFIMDVFARVYVNINITTFNSTVQGMAAYKEVIDVSNLKHGMYLLVLTGGSTTLTKKFVRVE